LRMSLCLLPLVPVGVWFGVRLNRKIPEKLFLRTVYFITFLAGLELVFDFNLARLFR